MRSKTPAAILLATALVIGGCGDDGDDDPGGSGSTTTSGGDTELPGGTAGADLLEQEGLLDDEGRVAPGPTAPEGDDVNAAICDYVFGTPEEVGELARLDGTVQLFEDSGYEYLGGGGSGVLCVYEVSGTQTYALSIWDQEDDPDDEDEKPTHVVTVTLPDDFYGTSSYRPDYDGEAIPSDVAERWLEAAGTRVAHGGV